LRKRRKIFAEIMELFHSGKLVPKTGSVFTFDEFPKALETSLNTKEGKVILVPRKKAQ